MSHKANDQLIDVLKDIAYTRHPDYELHPERKDESVKAGPNSWDNLTAADWGPEHDFELLDHGNEWIFWPVSNAALQWCYRKLPSDCPRWSTSGFRIEAENIKEVVAAARRDNLISEQDWHDANCEADDIARQWEGQ